jgi:hypothetical protein
LAAAQVDEAGAHGMSMRSPSVRRICAKSAHDYFVAVINYACRMGRPHDDRAAADELLIRAKLGPAREWKSCMKGNRSNHPPVA